MPVWCLRRFARQVRGALAPFFIHLQSLVVKTDRLSPTASKAADTAALDQLTGGAFTAPTTGERAARVREWLLTSPAPEAMAEVFKELSHRDKGAAKPLKEKLDELKRAKAQEGLVVEWAAKAEFLLAQDRLNVADAMAWQRDAARAGAPLSREPLSTLKAQVADRIKAIEDLQHRIQVEREAAVLLAQRIEVMSTKPLADSEQVRPALAQDVAQWDAQASALAQDPQWNSIDLRYAPMLDNSRAQLKLVWQAFDAALTQGLLAMEDAGAALPSVPVWADEIRKVRGVLDDTPAASAMSAEEQAAKTAQANERVAQALKALTQELEQGHGKALPKLAGELRQTLKEHGRWLQGDLEAQAQAALAQAGDLEGWQRWRADQLRQELVATAEALVAAPEGQRPGGRKVQEALRSLRERWKQTDQGGVPNHALWKRFDEACNQAHKIVEAWLDKLKAETAANRAQRLALIKELEDWAQQHVANTDWKLHVRELHRWADAWRNGGHLGEKQFAELQPLWKAAMAIARAPLEAAQADNQAQRQVLIARAEELGATEPLRMDAVRALQHEWQVLAQAVPLERKLEQRLWDAFRKPIDEAFQRKDAAREKQAQSLSVHDQRVLEASKALELATASQDAQSIHAAMQELEQALRGQALASATAPRGHGSADAAPDTGANPSAGADSATAPQDDGAPAAVAPAAGQAPAPVRKLVAVRGDDRPGMKKAEPALSGRIGRPADGRPGRDGGRDAFKDGGRDGGRGMAGGRRDAVRPDAGRPDRGPRLGDAAFRAQREALEHAQLSLKKLAAQAHGQVLTQLLHAWQARDGAALPPASELGPRVSASVRQAWAQALGAAPQVAGNEALLRLEMAAEVPTPASHLDARRALQLQLLTRRHEAAPAETWPQDATRVLASAWDEESARRLQHALKPLIRKN